MPGIRIIRQPLPAGGEAKRSSRDDRSQPLKTLPKDSDLADAGVSPREKKGPFPRVAGQRGRSLEF
jgi:hypothetical protein